MRARHSPDAQRWNGYAYVRNLPTRLTDPHGLSPVCNLDGMPLSCGMGTGLVHSGAVLQCPNNVCEGVNQYNLPIRYIATANASYYTPLLPGVWPSATAAGVAAVGSTNPASIATNTELGGNIYMMANGKYSWTLPHVSGAASVGWDPAAIPTGTDYAGAYHDHGAFDPNYLNEQFSPVGCNRPGSLCDIGIALSPGNELRPAFLGTPAGANRDLQSHSVSDDAFRVCS